MDQKTIIKNKYDREFSKTYKNFLLTQKQSILWKNGFEFSAKFCVKFFCAAIMHCENRKQLINVESRHKIYIECAKSLNSFLAKHIGCDESEWMYGFNRGFEYSRDIFGRIMLEII